VLKIDRCDRGSPSVVAGHEAGAASDFHYDGLRLSEEMLEQAIAASNQAEPDLVVTGDYVTDNPAPFTRYYDSNICKVAGIYAVLGNHDIYTPVKRVQAALSSIGIHVLWNEIAYPLGQELPIVGLALLVARVQNSTSDEPAGCGNTPIVLSHNPDTAKLLKQWRVDLQLSGHTHGGQFMIPGVPAVALQNAPPQHAQIGTALGAIHAKDCAKVVRHWEWAQGFHQVGTNQLYINRFGNLPGRILSARSDGNHPSCEICLKLSNEATFVN